MVIIEYNQEDWLIEMLARSGPDLMNQFLEFFQEHQSNLPFLFKMRQAIVNRVTILGTFPNVLK